MRLAAVLAVFLLSVSAWAGTFRDDFEDGNWQGWKIFGGSKLAVVEEERFSVVDGVLCMDTIVGVTDEVGFEMGMCLLRDWEDLRVIKVDPGH